MCKTRFGSQGVILDVFSKKKLKKPWGNSRPHENFPFCFFITSQIQTYFNSNFCKCIWHLERKGDEFDDENNAVLDYDEPKDDNDDLLSLLLLLSSQRVQPASPKGDRTQAQGLLTTYRVPQWGRVKIFIKKQTPAIVIVIVKNGHFYPKICFLEHI